METKTKTIPSKSKSDHQQSVAIMHAIEIESNFKLYSYRVISHEQFLTRTKELVQYFKNEMK
jgi:hypothetical protein